MRRKDVELSRRKGFTDRVHLHLWTCVKRHRRQRSFTPPVWLGPNRPCHCASCFLFLQHDSSLHHKLSEKQTGSQQSAVTSQFKRLINLSTGSTWKAVFICVCVWGGGFISPKVVEGSCHTRPTHVSLVFPVHLRMKVVFLLAESGGLKIKVAENVSIYTPLKCSMFSR